MAFLAAGACNVAEIELWQWRYTDDFGKRRVFPCRLSVEAAKHLRDAERIEGSLEIRTPLGSTSAFQSSPGTSTPAPTYEGAWQAFRFGHFKGLSDVEAWRSSALGQRRHGIEIKLEIRKVQARRHLHGAAPPGVDSALPTRPRRGV